jgi:hypothetical protein
MITSGRAGGTLASIGGRGNEPARDGVERTRVILYHHTKVIVLYLVLKWVHILAITFLMVVKPSL